MDQVVESLRQDAALIWSWRLIVWASAAYLLALGLLVFVRPAIVHRFFDGFVSSARINFLEAALRLITGLGYIGVSPETKAPIAFFSFGAVLAVTATMMMFMYRFHRKQASWAVPFAKKIMPLMGVCAVAFSVLIGWALTD